MPNETASPSSVAPDMSPPPLPHESPARATPPPSPSPSSDMSKERPDLTKGQFAGIKGQIDVMRDDIRYPTLKRFMEGAKIQARPWEQNMSPSLLGDYMKNPDAFPARHGYVPEENVETPPMRFGKQFHGLVDAYFAGKFDPERAEAFHPSLKGFATDPRFAEMRLQFNNFRNFSRYFDVLAHETPQIIRGGKAEEYGFKPAYKASGEEMPINMKGIPDTIVRFKSNFPNRDLAERVFNIDWKTSQYNPKDDLDLYKRNLQHMPQLSTYQFLEKHAKTPEELAAVEKMRTRNYNVEGYATYYLHLNKFLYFNTDALKKGFRMQTQPAFQALYETLAKIPEIKGLPPQYENFKKENREKSVF